MIFLLGRLRSSRAILCRLHLNGLRSSINVNLFFLINTFIIIIETDKTFHSFNCCTSLARFLDPSLSCLLVSG